MDRTKSILEEYREKNGLSQKALADLLCVSQSLVCQIEAGNKPITARRAKEWEPVLGIPRQQLCPEFFEATA